MSFLWNFGGRKSEADCGDRKGFNEVDKLLHRIESVTLIADRRDGVRALRKLAHEHRVEVGAQGMPILLSILEKDKPDQELVAATLEILCIVMSDSESVEAELSEGTKQAKAGGQTKVENKDPSRSQGAQFTEIFLKKPQHLALLLDFVKEFNFQIRWPAVRLLCIMANNSPRSVQDALLAVGGGISNLMDLLTDNREIIRNDGVLLLYFITRNNPSLQKIVAFGKAFDILLDVVRDEGCSEGGVVVEDCLLLLSNLLTYNVSNIKLFKEDGCVTKLCSWYTTDLSSSASWSEQRKINAVSMLGVIRCLVSPLLTPPIVRSCQDAINKCGLLAYVCNILMTPGVPLAVLVQALNTVAELIRGNRKNQEDFSAMEAPLNPPRSALAILLLSMFNDKQTFSLRLAVLYVLKSFLHKNEPMQLSILHSMVPDGSGQSQYTLGQLLGGAFFHQDSLNQWCSAVAFLHCIMENLAHKEYLLNVEFPFSATLPPRAVIMQCGDILREGTHLRSKIAVLQLLCVWLNDYPQAVSVFLQIPQITLVLLAQILDTALDPAQKLFQGLCAFLFAICINYEEDIPKRRELLDLVRNRIGFDTCREKIVEISRHENFVRTSHCPDPAVESMDGLLLDYDFVRFLKATEGKICESLDPLHEERKNESKERAADAVNQQREAVQAMNDRIAVLELQLNYSQARVNESSRQTEDLRRRSEVLTNEMQNRDQEIEALQQELRTTRSNLQNQHISTSATTEENARLKNDLQSQSDTVLKLQETLDQYGGYMQELDQLRTLAAHQQQQITVYYSYFEEQNQAGNSDAIFVLEKADLTARIAQLDALLYSWQTECSRLQEEVKCLQIELSNRTIPPVSENAPQQEYSAEHPAQVELDQLKAKYADLNAEHADLLELLTDGDDKVRSYRERLKRIGEPVSDDDA